MGGAAAEHPPPWGRQLPARLPPEAPHPGRERGPQERATLVWMGCRPRVLQRSRGHGSWRTRKGSGLPGEARGAACGARAPAPDVRGRRGCGASAVPLCALPGASPCTPRVRTELTRRLGGGGVSLRGVSAWRSGVPTAGEAGGWAKSRAPPAGHLHRAGTGWIRPAPSCPAARCFVPGNPALSSVRLQGTSGQGSPPSVPCHRALARVALGRRNLGHSSPDGKTRGVPRMRRGAQSVRARGTERGLEMGRWTEGW